MTNIASIGDSPLTRRHRSVSISIIIEVEEEGRISQKVINVEMRGACNYLSFCSTEKDII